MSAGDLTVLEALPCPVPGVQRHLVRTASGQIVEAVTLPEGRLEMLPRGGVFAPVTVAAGRVLLGAPLTRRLGELHPPPLAVLGLFSRILDDLDVLHREGGAHGALALEGMGVDESGAFRVRPVFHLAGELSPAADVRALGQVLVALAPADRLLAAGMARAAFFLSGLAVDGGRLGFPDGRAARQALAVATRGLPIAAACTAFLEGAGARLPAPAQALRTRPVSVAPPPDRAARTADARAWLDRSLDDARTVRFDRERAIADETERLSAELVAATEATLAAARAVAEHEAAQLARRTVTPAPAAFFVGAGQRAAPGEVAPVSPRLRLTPAPSREAEEEDVLDAASAEGGAMVGFSDVEAFVSSEPAEARQAAIEEAQRLAEAAERVAAAEAAAKHAAAEAAEREAAEREAAEAAARQAAEAAAQQAVEAARQAAEAARQAAEAAAAREAAEREAAEREAAEREAAEAAARETAAREAAEAAAREAAETAAREAAEAAARETAEREATARQAAEAAARQAAEATARQAAEATARQAAEAEARQAAEAAARQAAEAAARQAAEAAAGEAAAREAAEAAAREAAEAASEPPPTPGPPPEPPPRREPAPPAEFDDDEGADATPRWEGLGGVRGDESRMHEKGPGKWTLQGRSREELASQLPPGESRPMDLATPAPAASSMPTWAWAVVGLGSFVALAWWATG